MNSRSENSDGECPHPGSVEGQTEGEKRKDEGKEDGVVFLTQVVDSPAHETHEAKDELSDAVLELGRTLDGLDVDAYTEDDEGARIEELMTRIATAIFRIMELV
jgi:hypothetical protein